MGRPEKPLDPGTSPVARFANDLRRLREQAGTPTYRAMSNRAHMSTSALSTAASGEKFPSLPVCLAYVQACGGDVEAWRTRWQETHDLLRPAGPVAAPDEVTDAVADTSHSERRPRMPRGWMIPSAAGVVVLLVAGTWTLAAGSDDSSTPRRQSATAPAPGHPIGDGQDPYVQGCGPDQTILEQRPISQADGSLYGSLVFFYSRYCRGAWGYVFGPNSPRLAVHITAHRIGDNAAAPSMFRGKARNNSWGNALSTKTGCVRVEAWVNNGPHAMTSCWQPNGPVKQ